MLPWWRGFSGSVKKVGDNKYDVIGIAKKTDDTTVEITELPIHKWTQAYKVELEGMIGEKNDGPVKVCFSSAACWSGIVALQLRHRALCCRTQHGNCFHHVHVPFGTA